MRDDLACNCIYLAAFINNFYAGSPLLSIYMEKIHPSNRDIASFNGDLAKRAHPHVRTQTHVHSTVTSHLLAFLNAELVSPVFHIIFPLLIL